MLLRLASEGRVRSLRLFVAVVSVAGSPAAHAAITGLAPVSGFRFTCAGALSGLVPFASPKVGDEFNGRLSLPEGVTLQKLARQYKLMELLKGRRFNEEDPEQRGTFYLWAAAHPSLKPSLDYMARPFPHEQARIDQLRGVGQKLLAKAQLPPVPQIIRDIVSAETPEADQVKRVFLMTMEAAKRGKLLESPSYKAFMKTLEGLPTDPAAASQMLLSRFDANFREVLARELPFDVVVADPWLTAGWTMRYTDSSESLHKGLERASVRAPDESVSLAYQQLPNGVLRIEGLRRKPDGSEENVTVEIELASGLVREKVEDDPTCKGCHAGSVGGRGAKHPRSGLAVLDLQAKGMTASLKERGQALSDRGEEDDGSFDRKNAPKKLDHPALKAREAALRKKIEAWRQLVLDPGTSEPAVAGR